MPDVAHDPVALNLTIDDAHSGHMALLPTGAVWPRDPDGVLSRTVRGLVGVHHHAWRRLRDLLNEADPRTCYETIYMWETDCGLPDPCIDPPPISIEARRAAVVARRQEGSTTTPMQFVRLAAILGYEIQITEYRPFRCWSGCNDFLNTDIRWDPVTQTHIRVGWPHTWMVNIINADQAIWHMTCNSGCDSFLLEWTRGELECLFERIKPAHTHILFAYQQSVPLPAIWDDGDSIWDDGNSRWEDRL
jgi:uncharacterized protein YmfQ (DUF2313 family)